MYLYRVDSLTLSFNVAHLVAWMFVDRINSHNKNELHVLVGIWLDPGRSCSLFSVCLSCEVTPRLLVVCDGRERRIRFVRFGITPSNEQLEPETSEGQARDARRAMSDLLPRGVSCGLKNPASSNRLESRSTTGCTSFPCPWRAGPDPSEERARPDDGPGAPRQCMGDPRLRAARAASHRYNTHCS